MGNSINNIRRKHKFDDYCMDSRRNFGSPSGQLVNREPITPDLFMKIGTRVGNITAYYQHVPQVSSPTYPSKPHTLDQPSVPVPKIQLPTINRTPAIESVTPFCEQPLYDVPKSK